MRTGASREGAKRLAMAPASKAPVVGIIMGSRSDWETMSAARDTLDELEIPCEVRVLSAHRMPDEMFEYAESAAQRGLAAIIAGAGGAAHLPGMTAAKTLVPVIGVPVHSRVSGLDSLLSIAQMPPGVPVAAMAIGGAVNAALFAARIVALQDPGAGERLAAYVERMHDSAASSTLD
jgi:5-(carboxyamino)imidazole ribonucleotide mutase